MKIAFVHPDLGIGGAEKLIVDAAVGLQQQGHTVDIFTAHHDPNHAFEATRDGTLAVHTYGDWMPRSVFGRLHVFFAVLRCLWCSWALLLTRGRGAYDVIVCDQVSAMIPVLRLSKSHVVFYCHFPDLLLTQRRSWLKKLYRWPFDLLEEYTTAMAHRVLVNSEFTAGVVKATFTRLPNLVTRVVYPAIQFSDYDSTVTEEALAEFPHKHLLLSINRFERKKNLRLVVESFAAVRELLANGDNKDRVDLDEVHLVLAGGYDERVKENVEHLKELEMLASSLGVASHVTFVPSFSEAQRSALLRRATCVIYSPSNEHFGIVPLEAMYSRVPVVAVNSGGPMETVVNDVTGFHCEPEPAAFAQAIVKFLEPGSGEQLRQRMGDAGREHVLAKFAYQVFVRQWEEAMDFGGAHATQGDAKAKGKGKSKSAKKVD